MGLLDSLLPIIEKKNNSRPITVKTKDAIRQLLNEEARLERLASKSVNHDSNATEFYLERPIHELFDIYQYQEVLADDEAKENLSLLPVGKLSIFDDSDSETVDIDRAERTPFSINVAKYQERRKKIEQEQNSVNIIDYSPTPTTPALSVDMPFTTRNQLLPVEEEYQPNTQDVNAMLESILGEESIMEGVEEGLESVAETVIVPAIQLLSPPTTTASPPPVTREAEQSSSPPHITETNISPPQPYLLRPSPPQPPPSQLSLQVSPPQQSLPQLSQDHWYAEDQLITTDIMVVHPSSKRVFTYLQQMIPIFPTVEQMAECNKNTELAKTKTNMLFNMNFEKTISTLNFPTSNLDLTLDEQWNQSGKTIFIKGLLESLLGEDSILLIIAKDLSEEATLYEMIGQSLKLDCVRVNYLLDDDWDGEYGVFVKTKTRVDQQKGTAQRGSNFMSNADLVICMDVRISRDYALFEKISKRGDETKLPPVTWLIALGSVEERAFAFLNQHNLLISQYKSEEFKDLMREVNDWPKDDHSSTEQLNIAVAGNVKSWLLSYSAGTANYQYKSTLALPKSFHYANTKPLQEEPVHKEPAQQPVHEEPAQQPVLQQDNMSAIEDGHVSDMDIGSDSDDALPTIITPFIISTKARNYLTNTLFPAFDTSKGDMEQFSREQELLTLSDADRKIISKVPSGMYSDYCTEVNNLKRQYEVAFQELQQMFREKAFAEVKKQ